MTFVVHLLSFNLYYTVEFYVIVVNIFIVMGSVIISVNNFIFASFIFFFFIYCRCYFFAGRKNCFKYQLSKYLV